MIALAAAFHRSGHPVSPGTVATLLAGQAFLGPGERWVRGYGEVCLGRAGGPLENSPLKVEEGRRYVLAFDGRLDERRHLWSALGMPAPLAETADAALALAALEAWGLGAGGGEAGAREAGRQGALERLAGSFALIVFDRRNRSLTLARDPLGGRGLAFAEAGDLFLVATEEAALAQDRGVDRTLDDVRLAQYFSCSELVGGRTFFRGVRQVEPGTAVEAVRRDRRRELRSWSFWRPEPVDLPRPLSRREAAERLRSALFAAVGRRLEGCERSGVMLSGGLDSTPLAAITAQLGKPAVALSWTFDEHPSCDERQYFTGLRRQLGLQAVEVGCDDAWPLRGLGEGAAGGWPLHPATPEQNAYRLFHQRAYDAAARAGVRVVLSGMGGDQLYGGHDRWLWDLVRRGRLGEAVREAVVALRRAPGGAPGLLGVARGLCPRRVSGWLKGIGLSGQGAPWLTAEARDLLEGQHFLPAAEALPRPSQARRILDPLNAHGLAVERSYAARYGIEVRYPFRDRQLVELMLSLETRHLHSSRRSRPVLRQAFAGDLPREILEREGKTTFEPVFRRGLFQEEAGEVRRLLFRPGRSWPRFVREDWLERESGLPRSSTRGGEVPGSSVGALVLWLCVCWELWLEASEVGAGQPSGIGRRKAVGWC